METRSCPICKIPLKTNGECSVWEHNEILELKEYIRQLEDRLSRWESQASELEKEYVLGLGKRLQECEDKLEFHLARKGLWSMHDLRRAFVAGAKWWEFDSTGATMWQSDQRKVEAEAERRYPSKEEERE